MGGHLSLHQSVRQGAAETLRTTCARIRDVNVTESVEGVQVSKVEMRKTVRLLCAVDSCTVCCLGGKS